MRIVKNVLMWIFLILGVPVLIFAFNFPNGSFEVASGVWQNAKFEFPACGISDISLGASDVFILSNDGELDVYSYNGTLKNWWTLWNNESVDSTMIPVEPNYSGMAVAKKEIFVAYNTRDYAKSYKKKGKVSYVDIKSRKEFQDIMVFDFSGKLVNKFGKLLDPVDVKVFNSKVYVADGMKNEILIYNMNGKLLQKIKMPTYRVNSPEKADVFLTKDEYHLVHHPESLSISDNGIYVIGSDGRGRNFLYHFDRSGEVLKMIPVDGERVFTFAKEVWVSGKGSPFTVYDKGLNKLGVIQEIRGMKINDGLLAYHERNGRILLAISSSVTTAGKNIRFFYLERR